jgi:hypothetical protein
MKTKRVSNSQMSSIGSRHGKSEKGV